MEREQTVICTCYEKTIIWQLNRSVLLGQSKKHKGVSVHALKTYKERGVVPPSYF